MIVLQGYLHFGTGNEPRQTVSVPVREADAPRSGQTVYGYGSKIPAPYMVQWAGRWRRVYVARYGNALAWLSELFKQRLPFGCTFVCRAQQVGHVLFNYQVRQIQRLAWRLVA